MITVQEADQLIRQHVLSLGTQKISLKDSHGMTLAEELTADRDYPPFHRVAMDGYALQHAQWAKGQRKFFVEGIQTAGQKPLSLKNPEAAIEIMTGAALAAGCDLVVRYEDTTRFGEYMVIADDAVLERMQNVHQMGADAKRETKFSTKRMDASLAALAASFGYDSLLVNRTPRVAMLGTGDELVAVDANPLDYQIRESNISAVRMALESRGLSVHAERVRDDRSQIFAAVERALHENDWLLLSGGVSAGKTDFVPEILQELGVKPIFHKIAQRPGKPLWFGLRDDGKTVFGLPGNPVSSLVCLYRYVLPMLEGGCRGGTPLQVPFAELKSPRPKQTRLTYFMPVRIDYTNDARIEAIAGDHNGSGDFISLAGTDGFIEIPGELEDDHDPSNTYFKFYGWT